MRTDAGHGTTALFLLAVLAGCLFALALIGGEKAMCVLQPEVERSYCGAGR